MRLSMSQDVLFGEEVLVLVNYAVGVGNLFEDIYKRSIGICLNLLSSEFTTGKVLLDFLQQFLSRTSDELLRLLYINKSLLKDWKSLVVPADPLRYSNAINTSHLRRLNLLPWMSFLGRGVRE